MAHDQHARRPAQQRAAGLRVRPAASLPRGRWRWRRARSAAAKAPAIAGGVAALMGGMSLAPTRKVLDRVLPVPGRGAERGAAREGLLQDRRPHADGERRAAGLPHQGPGRPRLQGDGGDARRERARARARRRQAAAAGRRADAVDRRWAACWPTACAPPATGTTSSGSSYFTIPSCSARIASTDRFWFCGRSSRPKAPNSARRCALTASTERKSSSAICLVRRRGGELGLAVGPAQRLEHALLRRRQLGRGGGPPAATVGRESSGSGTRTAIIVWPTWMTSPSRRR